jgi:hypothetical protein
MHCNNIAQHTKQVHIILQGSMVSTQRKTLVFMLMQVNFGLD